MDGEGSSLYIGAMATVLTPREQQETASIAWRLGGYEDTLRLERELKAVKAKGKTPKMVMDPVTKRRKIVEA